MALLVVEGFDHMQNVTLMESKNWTFATESVPDGFTPSIGTGRINGHALFMQSTFQAPTNFGKMFKTLPSLVTHFVSGFAFQCSYLPDIGTWGPMFAFVLDDGTLILTVWVGADGSVRVKNSAGTTLATSATGLFTANAWHQFEVKGFANGASGNVQVHLNGVEIIASTTVNIGSTGIQYAGPYSISNTGWNSSTHALQGVLLGYDDFWLADTSAGIVSDFIGDAHVETIFPNADGSHSDWTPDSGGVHFSRVNERTGTYPDGDTSYVGALTVGNQDSWAYDDLSIVTGTVFGVQTNLYARKEDANLRQLVPIIVQSASTYAGATTQTLASGYTDSTEIFEDDPHSAAQWTITGVNSAEFGAKITA